ncbi:hypothetical protein VJ923_09030 [Adlercreutzia sp. R25]|uniref:hypothetical protein n=1 Tax=Adlercreutzia shanghongiae TaxID=3111773 RepID=UPI002DBD6F94|nr:hypothetical protein [Adlercreutzia sp. R25]MEC4273299.1 hypothetical protein [Adlercreutzia sp. R25]
MTLFKGFRVASLAIGLLCALWILVVACAQCIKASDAYRLIGTLGFLLAIALLGRATWNRPTRIKLFLARYSGRVAWVLIGIMSFLLLLFSFRTAVDFSWDWGQLIKSASAYVLTGELDRVDYYARYPNNQFWLMCLTLIFKGVKFVVPTADIVLFKNVSIVLSCACTVGAVIVTYLTAQMHLGKKAIIVIFLAFGCLPLYLYSSFFYTDSPGILLCALILYLSSRLSLSANTKEKAALVILIGLICALIVQIKVMVLIVAIAIAIAATLNAKSRRQLFLVVRRIAAIGVICIVLCSAFNVAKAAYVDIDSNMENQYEFPVQHWVMMGLGYGGFSQDDVDFTKSFETLEDKKRANFDEIAKRITNRGVLGTAEHLLYTKALRTWGNPCLAGDDYINRHVIHNGRLQQWFALGGTRHDIVLGYAWAFWLLLLSGIALEPIIQLKGRCTRASSLLISLIGIFLFFSLWECNSRYLYVFLPVLILLSSHGYALLVHKADLFRKRIRE